MSKKAKRKKIMSMQNIKTKGKSAFIIVTHEKKEKLTMLDERLPVTSTLQLSIVKDTSTVSVCVFLNSKIPSYVSFTVAV